MAWYVIRVSRELTQYVLWDLMTSSHPRPGWRWSIVVQACWFEQKMFLFPKNPVLFFITDPETQKLNTKRSCSAHCLAQQATLATQNFENDTEGNNAVMKLCFLEARKNNTVTGKIYVCICLFLFKKGSNKGSSIYFIWFCVAIKLALVHEKPGALGQEAYSGEGGEWICLIIYPLCSLR